MNQLVTTCVAGVALPSEISSKLAVIESRKVLFLRDFPYSADPYSLDAMNDHVSKLVEALRHEWGRVCNSEDIDSTQVGAWAKEMVAHLDEYLNTRMQGKYYLPAWDEMYSLKCRLVQDLPEKVHLDDLDRKCYEIAPRTYSMENQRIAISPQPLMGCIQGHLVEEIRRGVYGSLSSFGAREMQIVALLRVLVTAAESGMLSSGDMERMRDFIKTQTEMRPVYEDIDLATNGDCRRAIVRQDTLLKAALPFFK